MNQYFYPSCGSVIELESINVATDVALCRNCGTASLFLFGKIHPEVYLLFEAKPLPLK
jgi:hypothetical protein